MSAEYRDFTYPLNVFMHVLTRENGRVGALHYGLFERGDESLEAAQRRSTDLLRSRLPPPPASILEVGMGLGDTLAELTAAGYRATGITPDGAQLAIARRRHPGVDARLAALETYPGEPADVVVFQESAQYIAPAELWRRTAELARGRVVVLDEFALGDAPGLPPRDGFVAQAAARGFELTEEVDLSARAAPTMAWFAEVFPRHRDAVLRDLGVGAAELDALMASGARYRELYARGLYGYRLLVFQRPPSPPLTWTLTLT